MQENFKLPTKIFYFFKFDSNEGKLNSDTYWIKFYEQIIRLGTKLFLLNTSVFHLKNKINKSRFILITSYKSITYPSNLKTKIHTRWKYSSTEHYLLSFSDYLLIVTKTYLTFCKFYNLFVSILFEIISQTETKDDNN